MSEDYYKILSVEPTASQKEIQQAADKLISNWGEKRGQSNQKRSEMLSQIRRASAILTDPLQRFEYDIKHGFKRDFSEQSLMKKSPFIPLKYSESIETIDTVKIPGGLDYEKLEKSIAAMETADLAEVKDFPDIKPLFKSSSLKNGRTARVIDEISQNRPVSETAADIIRESGRFKENSSNLKQDFTTDYLKTSGKEPSTLLDTDTITETSPFKGNSSNLKQDFTTVDLKTSGEEPAMLHDADIITESNQLKRNYSNLNQDFTIDDLKTSGKESETLLDADINMESGRLKGNSSNLEKDFTTEDLKTSDKQPSMLLDADIISENDRLKGNSSNLIQDSTIDDLKTSGKKRETLLDADIIRKSGRLKENSSNLKQDFTTDDLKTFGKELATLLDADINTESCRFKGNSSNLKQDFTTDDLKTSGKETGTLLEADIITESGQSKANSSNFKQDFITGNLRPSGNQPAALLDIDKVKEKKKTLMKDWKDSISETDIISGPIESVTVTKRIAGTDVETIYSFGSDAEFIEVFVNGGLRVKIFNDESHDMYYNGMKHDELPPGVIVGASTVIAANSCTITTEVTRRGKRESIVVYKNDTLLCRTGSAILED